MFFSNSKLIAIVTIALSAIILVQGKITEDRNLVVKWPRSAGQHAIQIVGDPSKIQISATNYKTVQNAQSAKIGIQSSGKCKKMIKASSGLFEGPCTLTTAQHDQTYLAECTNGKGSASIYFPKLGSSEKNVNVLTAGPIWAGFSNKKNQPLKQGNLKNDGDRVAVILNCDGDQRGHF